MMEFEFLVLDFIYKYIKNPFFDFLMPKITFLGNDGIIWIVSALVMLAIPRYRKSGLALSVGLLACLVIGNLTLKPLVARVRPYEFVEGIELLISTPTDFSFPSGHTMSSVVSASILTMADKRFGYATIPLATLIAFSRLYLYVHFLTDVLGGVVIGAVISIAIYYIFYKKKA